MTGEDIQQKVERYTQKEPDIDLVKDGIQEAINWLGNMNYIIGTIEISAEENEEYELPSELIRVIKVETTEDNSYYTSYLIDGNIIRFEDTDDYRIYAEQNPFVYDDETEELEMHPMLQGCILNYVKGFCKLSIDDTSEDGHKLIEQFKENAAKAYETLKRGQRSPTKVWVKRHA